VQRSVRRLTSRAAVLRAMELYDSLGGDEFLARHGFGRSQGYVLVHDARQYDSKAVAGVAFGFEHPDSGPLRSAEFSGGSTGAALVLRRLGFHVTGVASPEPASTSASHTSTASPGKQVPPPEVAQSGPHVLLLGCVKGKGPRPAPARELYRSDLFRKRRAYAEASARPWFILSAQHGLVHPDDLLAPYDMALEKQSAAYRAGWGREVAAALQRCLGPLSGTTFEVHAGAPYVEAIRGLLEAAGASVVLPLRGLTQGQQLRWYLDTPTPKATRRPPPSPTALEVDAAVAALTYPRAFCSPKGFPWGRADLSQPGLYAWSVDDHGARDLTRGSGQPVGAGLVYAGQAGATAWPSGTQPQSTLSSRIRGNHLRGRVTASTWRLSLAALLQEPLGLQLTHGELDDRSKTALTQWMENRLRLAVHPAPDRDTLGALEHVVLVRLNPPLNLDRMSPTPLRAVLTARRAALLAVGG
jgi:hypothetical protein